MEILKRLTAALLALMMIFTMQPLGALATETKPVGDGVLDVPVTTETEAVETVPETTAPEVFVEETAVSVDVPANGGACGDNLIWSFEETTGTLTISGKGKMWDYENSYRYYHMNEHIFWEDIAPWYNNSITNIVICDGVTSIGNEAFYYATELTNITIPDSVTNIGGAAFNSCINLTSISIPDSITSIGDNAFGGCTSLTSVLIPGGVLSIGKAMFLNCTSLSSVIITSGVTSIGGSAFYNCKNLTSIDIPSSVTSIGAMAFYECDSLVSITIPEGVTSIGDTVFGWCDSLASVHISDSVTSIGDWLFQQCNSLTSVRLGKGITSITEQMFTGCISLTSISIPHGVISIESDAFGFCENLSSIYIPDSVTYIDDRAFWGCDLSDIYYSGTKEQWQDVDWFVSWNMPPVNIHYNIAPVSSNNAELHGHQYRVFSSSISWIEAKAYCENLGGYLATITSEEENQFIYNYISSSGVKDAYFGLTDSAEEGTWEWVTGESMSYANWHLGEPNQQNSGEDYGMFYYKFPDGTWNDGDGKTTQYFICEWGDYTEVSNYRFVLSPDIENLTVKTGQPLEITVYLYHGDELVTDLVLPDLALGHLGGEKILNYIGWEPTGDGGYVLKLKGAAPGVENLTIYDETTDTKLDFSVTVTKAEVNEYLDNSEIKINDSGSAFAYYIGDPEQDFLLTVNEKKQSVHSNEKGVFRVSLGTFAADGKENVTVKVTHIGGGELPEPLVFHSCITVTPLEFSQSWEASMDASLGAKLMAGAEFKPFKLKASLGEVGGKIGGGTAMNISRSYSAEGETLELTSDKKVQAGLTVKCGITGQALAGKFESGASLNVGGSDTITYGLKIKDYSPDNSAQQKAVATYLLGEALFSCPGNVIVKNFYDHMAESVYQNASGTIVHGSASKLSGSFGGGIATATINGVEIASVLESEVSAAIVQAEKTASDGSQEKSMSANLDMNLSAVTPAKRVEGSEIGVNSSVLSADFLGADIKVAAKQSENEKTLEASSLSASAVEMNIIEVGVPSTAVYSKYIFKDEAMDGLLSSTKHFDDYVNRNLFVLALSDLCELADVLSTSDAPIEYKSETKDKYAISLPLEFGLGLGTDIDFGVTLSYLADTSYTNATGYAVEDSILLTSESGDLSSQVKANKRDLVEIFTNCIQSLANDAANFFKKIGNTIQQGVEDAWGWIEEKADSVKDWFVSLTCVSTEEAWGESTEIGVLGSYVNFALARQSVNPNEAYVTRTAMTIGRPFVVSVTDNTTGEAVTDFSEEPLEFTLRYAGEDLMAADYDVETQEIAMYRYSDDGDYFEHIGGLHDADAMTVTAIITKPGQYILAAEEIAEKGCGYALGDVNHDAKINAKDATLILQSSVGVLKPTASFCETCAEVSGDGKLNAKDSTMILQYSVGARTEFPGQK